MKFAVLVLFILLIASCGGGGESSPSPVEAPGTPGQPPSVETPPSSSCDLNALESEMSTQLNSAVTDVDFTLYMEREDGRQFSFSKGSSTLDTVYDSASTSKWVSASVILWLLNRTPQFDLSDIPSEYYNWSMSSGEALYNTTMSQLLSFTSGLREEPDCLKLGLPIKSFDQCINDATGSIVSENTGKSYTPNTSFYYSSSHLQVAGAVAVAATSSELNWQELFTRFKNDTELFTNSSYSLPSTSNPRLAGGMRWTARDYLKFLRSIYKNHLFIPSSRDQMFSDQVGGLTVEYSPAFNSLNEQWHYGYGVWLECENSSFNCTEVDYYSSPGAYGAYPFVNFNKKFFGILARQGALGTYPNGVSLFRSVRAKAEEWASCNNSSSIEKGLIRRTIDINGTQREYLLYVPESYDGNTALPLLFSFHGNGSDMDFNYNYTDFKLLAEKHNFIVVHPQGTLPQSGKRFWNITGMSFIDDLGFVDGMLQEVSSQYQINSQRVYSTGMSNGGFFSFVLACQRSHKIAAIASVTGLMTNNTINNCSPTRPLSVLQIHGTSDPVANYSGVQNVIGIWNTYNSLTVESTSSLSDLNVNDGSTVEKIVHSSPNSNIKVQHFRVNSGGHAWPGAWGNKDIKASEEVWDFLKNYSL